MKRDIHLCVTYFIEINGWASTHSVYYSLFIQKNFEVQNIANANVFVDVFTAYGYEPCVQQ